MNPNLERLQPYPFERLRDLLEGLSPPPDLPLLDLSIGEPRHAPPEFVLDALHAAQAGFRDYPKTAGSEPLRRAIGNWLNRRYRLPVPVDPNRHIQPVSGTREALFAITQCLAGGHEDALVAIPNPGYQVYEGAALLAGAEPLYYPLDPQTGQVPDLSGITDAEWARVRLLFLCSPGNPAGGVIDSAQFSELIERAGRFGFTIVSDECYSELYTAGTAPPGILEVCAHQGRQDYRHCLAFHSLSKRSSLPGLRSGFVAGDARLIDAFRLYRSYQGCTMPPPLQAASAAAWDDETHVEANRALYRRKFQMARRLFGDAVLPAGGFYLWLPVSDDDQAAARRLYEQVAVKVLPGSFLGREVRGVNPGTGYLRLALVHDLSICEQALRRVQESIR